MQSFYHPTLAESTTILCAIPHVAKSLIVSIRDPAYLPQNLTPSIIMSSDPSQPQDQPVPTAPGGSTESGTDSSPVTVTGATRDDAEEVQGHISLVEGIIKNESSPVRRRNAEVCLEFVKQHGYPVQGYRFFIHEGVIQVLEKDQYEHITDELNIQTPGCLKGSFILVCSWPFFFLSPCFLGHCACN